MTESPWLTTKEAAAYLKTTVTALNKHVHRGTLIPDSRAQNQRFRGHRYLQSTLDRFLCGAVLSEDGKDTTDKIIVDRRRQKAGTRQVPRTRYLD